MKNISKQYIDEIVKMCDLDLMSQRYCCDLEVNSHFSKGQTEENGKQIAKNVNLTQNISTE